MLRIPCPKCSKTFLASDVEAFQPCLHCGFVFSGKYGAEKRREKRTPRKISFSFSFQDRTFEASTLDVSENGVGIQLLPHPPISKGDVLNLPIGDPAVVAEIMWVKNLPDKSLVGLQRIC
jgi:hypothetical protein